jgi:hypothetical protein
VVVVSFAARLVVVKREGKGKKVEGESPAGYIYLFRSVFVCFDFLDRRGDHY